MTYEFPLYQTSTPLRISNINETLFNDKHYGERPETKFFDVNQVQLVEYKAQSDNVWGASSPYRFFFRDLLVQAADPANNINVEAMFMYEYFRPVSRNIL